MLIRQEKGNALLEFAISLFFFIPVIIGIIDVCIMLTNYQKLEQAVREGVRTASRMPELTPDFIFENHDTPSHIDSCKSITPPPPSTSLDCAHVLLHSRVRAILRHEYIIGFEVTNSTVATLTSADLKPVIVSKFCPTSATATANCPNINEQDTITFSASGSYSGFFGTWPLTATYEGPWLFQNVTTN